VREVQAALAEGGYYRGPIDGIFGGGTRRAVRAFQRDKNLPVTGRINSALLDKLNIG
jgi:peptidoglycan hydrolase-like protein with peptidoglycan-binding domain